MERYWATNGTLIIRLYADWNNKKSCDEIVRTVFRASDGKKITGIANLVKLPNTFDRRQDKYIFAHDHVSGKFTVLASPGKMNPKTSLPYSHIPFMLANY